MNLPLFCFVFLIPLLDGCTNPTNLKDNTNLFFWLGFLTYFADYMTEKIKNFIMIGW